MRICSIDGCSNKHLAKGFCVTHYLRQYKYGSPHIKKTMRGDNVMARILAKTIVTAGGCWLFQGALTERGYGHVRDGKKMRMAHVLTYEDKHGPVPDGLELDHTCRCRSCCNPDHVEPVTHAVNVRRGIAGHDHASRLRDFAGRFSGAIDKGLV